MRTEPLQRAVDLLGSQSALGHKAGVQQQAIWNWLSGGRRIPAAHCPNIERATHGRVTCDELRPDVRWARIADPDWPHPKGRPTIDVAGSASEAA